MFAVLFAAMLGTACTAIVIRRARGAGTLALALLPLAAIAAEPPSLEQLLQSEVVTASRFAQPLAQSPSNIEVISAEQIRALGYRTITDVLRGMAGLHITNDRNYEYLGVNGLSNIGDYNSRVLVLLDGMRLNDPFFGQGPLGWLFPVDLSQVARIEFVHGPGSSLYGGNALYGVINVITKKGPASSVGVTAGSYGIYQGRANLSDAIGPLRYDIYAGRNIRRGQTLAFEEFPGPDGKPQAVSQDQEAATHAGFKLGAGNWTLQSRYSGRAKQLPAAPYGTQFGSGEHKNQDISQWTELSHTLPVSETLLLSTRLLAASYRYVAQSPFLDQNQSRFFNDDDVKARWNALESSVQWQATPETRVIAGLELQKSTELTQTNGNRGQSLFLDDHRTARQHGLFAQVDSQLANELHLYGGLRFDKYTPGGSAVSPRLAAVWQISPTLTLRASLAEAFRTPNAFELFYHYELVDSVASRWLENTALKPERLLQAEVSANYMPKATSRFSTSVFALRAKQQIQLSTSADGSTFQFQNTGVTRGHGLRIGFEQVFEGGGRLKLAASGQSASDDNTAQQRLNSPALTAQGQLITPLGAGWLLGSELIHVASRRGERGLAPAYSLLNFSLSKVDAFKDMDVSLSLVNALNKTYYSPAAADFRQAKLQQEGRTLQLRLDYRY